MYFDQAEYALRCEWGAGGIGALAADSDAIVIIDVLSFSTSVDVAVSRGAVVYPFADRGTAAEDYARERDAVLAHPDRHAAEGLTLSPASLLKVTPELRLVLPSLNGSTLSLATGDVPTFAGCLRNAEATAAAALTCGSRISVIPAGERWRDDGSLRPALEDWIGAGAILAHLPGMLSPEAAAAVALFRHFSGDLAAALRGCSSGRELIEEGFDEDVALAAMLNVSRTAPRLRDKAYAV